MHKLINENKESFCDKIEERIVCVKLYEQQFLMYHNVSNTDGLLRYLDLHL